MGYRSTLVGPRWAASTSTVRPSTAIREAREETNLEVELLGQLKSYSDPRRDPRLHTITTVFIARGRGEPRAQDDAANIGLFAPDALR